MRLTLTALPHPTDALFSGSAHIEHSRYSIGRGENNDWVLSDAKRLISKNHCVIEPAGQGFRLVDRSTNGTTVSGKPVDRNSGHMLRSGDEIELGPYRFRAAVENEGRHLQDPDSAFDSSAAMRITSILHDIAPSGIGAQSPVLGEKKDAFEEMGGRKGRNSAGALAAGLGWDGPPPAEADVVRPRPPMPPYRELADRMEQGPTHKALIDLPKPYNMPAPQPEPEHAQIIPENWLDEEDGAPDRLPERSAASAAAPSALVRPLVSKTADLSLRPVTEVRNLEIPGLGFDQGPAPNTVSPPQGRQGQAPVQDIAAAFCDGLGIRPSELADVDAVRFFHNAGRALAISVSELQNAEIARSRAVALLEMGSESVGRTPWIFSLSGEDKTRVVQSVAAFLAEAEPRDLEMMRADHTDVQALIGQLSQALIGLVERLQQSISPAELDKHVSTAARTIPSLKKAALWEAFLTQSGLFPQGAKANAKADLLPLLKAELKNHGGPEK